MTLYAGETVQVTLNATDFDGELLTPDRVTSVTVTISDAESVVVVDEAELDWNGGESLWIYTWDTTDQVGGAYRAKVTVLGLDDTVSFEYKTIRLKSEPGA